MTEHKFKYASSRLTLEINDWVAEKRKSGFKMDVILDSLGLVEQDERHLLDMQGKPIKVKRDE